MERGGVRQAKDVAAEPILRFVHAHGGIGCNWFEVGPDDDSNIRSVRRAMPPETPDKVVLAKMRALIRKGYVRGCGCGCRGDFELTDKGRSVLTRNA